jgi:hypothetical protein
MITLFFCNFRCDKEVWLNKFVSVKIILIINDTYLLNYNYYVMITFILAIFDAIRL